MEEIAAQTRQMKTLKRRFKSIFSRIKLRLIGALFKSLYVFGFRGVTPFYFNNSLALSKMLGFTNAKNLFKLERVYHELIVGEKNQAIREKLYIAFNIALDHFRGAYFQDKLDWGFNKKYILENKNLFLNKTVLDFGCGYGLSTELLGKFAKFVYGLDCSQVCIDNAIERIGHIDNISFQLTNGMRLPYEEATIDAIYSNDVIEHLHVDDVLFHLKEAHRVLKPDGVYLIFTPDRNKGPHDITGYFWPMGCGIPPLGAHINEFSFEDLSSLLKQAGFSDCIIPEPRIDVLLVAKKT
ncbi:MAG: class I SAM-dependent methyltransferase [Deltaproteobacteria bacterium]|jgi:SAM-dependent methyltransferase|nr:class I SAM-dependent methyltransferase [Deltaproteobacteria bacterium]